VVNSNHKGVDKKHQDSCHLRVKDNFKVRAKGKVRSVGACAAEWVRA
jgi:hypothetical protein